MNGMPVFPLVMGKVVTVFQTARYSTGEIPGIESETSESVSRYATGRIITGPLWGYPLSDIRVLSIESYGAGPWATLQLADLGAEIIKIEIPRTGDISRYVPPGAKNGDSLFFQCLNRNKKSVTLDLRTDLGKETFYRLLPAMDILFANPKGTMPEKMGFTYESLEKYNKRLVCCFLTGYGRNKSIVESA